MANSIQDISSSKVKILNPDAIYVTPFTDENTRGDATYKLSEVIRDTTSLTQDDPETNEILNEFSDSPIHTVTKLGAYQFAAQVADMQAQLLEKLCGYTVGTTATDRVFAPSKYNNLYCEIALAFKTGPKAYTAAVLPKVLLNSKATFESLSSNMGVVSLAGTGQNIGIQDGASTIETPFYIDYNFKPSEL